ncbi:hypothetical protein PP175_28390 (plasmid) [Aneurinibacillus sp. Ricciae_BoGa-3]|uniref:hypothetical protein n=1 Tax=Aneurinibacillus sp. Ricciae_BoGa-3 TaxID=3022697 RepID=UPI00234065F3|nr:hypothetical protein [Aneurinibacillus sp. Ricciae_BoGa-3]WCK57111.1 hypothetical protein PP175_28390 [Aneurinibacillus sp. Ricciae_BoGa-3]
MDTNNQVVKGEKVAQRIFYLNFDNKMLEVCEILDILHEIKKLAIRLQKGYPEQTLTQEVAKSLLDLVNSYCREHHLCSAA